jgi:cyclase
MKRILILATIVGAGALAIGVVAQQPPAAGGARVGGGANFPPVDKIEKVAENLYRIAGGGGNSAVWVRSDGVLLVDTKVAGNGPKLLDLIHSVTNKPVTHIINTHTHGDHTGSNSFFPAIVEVVAQANTAANMQKMDAFKTEEGKVGLPDRTFADSMTMFSGKDAVDLYYFGPAHTNGDALVVFRSVRVMHAGDIFATKGLPLLDVANGGSGLQYAATIAKAVAGIRNVDTVITGHSDVMKWQDFVDYGEFNRLYGEYAKTALAAGKTPEQAMIDFRAALPARFKDYNLAEGRGGPAGNFAILYAELGKT